MEILVSIVFIGGLLYLGFLAIYVADKKSVAK